MSTKDRTRRLRRATSGDGGWVLVPTIALLVVALGLGFALLAVVDAQTSDSREQRANDAAQTFSEGVVAATASVMASSNGAAGDWRTTGTCDTFNHRLSDTTGATPLEAAIVTAVHDRFAGTSSDVTDGSSPLDLRRTTWSVSICPVQGRASTTKPGTWTQDDETWSPSIVGRTVAPAGTPTSPSNPTTVAQPAGTPPSGLAMWVRAQGNVQSTATSATQVARRSRAVVSKVRQNGSPFVPGTQAIATGGLKNAVATGLSSTLFASDSLVGGLTSQLAGTKPLVSGTVGTRCTLLHDVQLTTLAGQGLSDLCLNGTLGGAGGTVTSLGAGPVGTLLGVGNQQSLSTWASAPPDARAAYLARAKAAGTYYASINGYGNDAATSTSTSGTNTDCVNWNAPEIQAVPAAQRVIYIGQVGNGEQYCTLTSGQAAIVIVERGAIRVTGSFTGVVYAANLQECGSDGICTAGERQTGGQAANRREVVRIENGGTVTGAVWADGAGGQVGIYPPTATSTNAAPTSQNILDAVKDPTNSACPTAPVGTGGVVSSLTSGLVGTLGGLLGTGSTVVYTLPDGTQITGTSANGRKPTGCEVLLSALRKIGTSGAGESATAGPARLAKLLSDGGDLQVTVTTSTTTCVAGLCSQPKPGSYTQTVTIPPSGTIVGSTPAGGAPPNPISGILNATGASLGGYQAVTYDAPTVQQAGVVVTAGASPITGSYQNVPPVGGFGT